MTMTTTIQSGNTYSATNTEYEYRKAQEKLLQLHYWVEIRKSSPLNEILGLDVYVSSITMDEKVEHMKNMFPEFKVWGNKNNERIYLELK